MATRQVLYIHNSFSEKGINRGKKIYISGGHKNRSSNADAEHNFRFVWCARGKNRDFPVR